MKKQWPVAIVALLIAAGVSVQQVGGGRVAEGSSMPAGPEIDLSSFSADPPGVPLRMLFIHHSCGGQLLAPVGPDQGDHCIYRSHPNGGGLRPLLEHQGYEIHEASYGSLLGENTDLFDWPAKFKSSMDRVLSVSHQDELYPDGTRNQIVVFKSCFPNSKFVERGQPPGNPAGPTLSVWNARAMMTSLLPEFARHPEVLFVYVTAPPLAPTLPREPVWKWAVKTALGRATTKEQLRATASLAREFNNWVKAPDGWLRGYPHHNVVVFDYYDILTGGRGDLSNYPTGDGTDSHPSPEGNRRAASAFVPFLNRAVRYAGLVH